MATVTKQQELQALHEQLPESVMSDILNCINNMEQSLAKQHTPNVSKLEHRIDKLESTVSQQMELEQQINKLEATLF